MEDLHKLVQKPREQVADAEALLDITNSLVASVKAHGHDGITPSDFVNGLLRDFGRQDGPSTSADGSRNLIAWKDIGVAVSHIFSSCPGCCTMVGPMDTELKQRKAVVGRRRTRPTGSVQPEEVNDSGAKERTDTDKNMATMFSILKNKRSVKLENLVLNRNSFAQTVENLFALSFLVKDGRAEIKVNENGWHLVSPRNAPDAGKVVSGEVAYRHFVFRFDFKDWKLMISAVEVGEELMPNRNQINMPSDSLADPIPVETQAGGPTTPIRKFSRNRGLVLQEKTVVEDSTPENDNIQEHQVCERERRERGDNTNVLKLWNVIKKNKFQLIRYRQGLSRFFVGSIYFLQNTKFSAGTINNIVGISTSSSSYPSECQDPQILGCQLPLP